MAMRDRMPIDLDTTRAALCDGRPVLFPDIDVTVCEIHGQRFCFASDRVRDPIQRSQRNGAFYEAPELAMIRAHFPQGGTFVDIGANVGNHAIYVAAFLQPGRIIPFEPNPVAYKLLLANVALNGFGAVFDLSHIGLGLSDGRASGFGMTPRDRNLGGAQMVEGGGDIETISGDAALAAEAPDFIKIDVEGMEMQVLGGLAATIARARPVILIEVDVENDADFRGWIAEAGYEIVETMQRYKANRNYLLRPVAAVADKTAAAEEVTA